MAQISKLLDSGKASYGSLSRWEKSAAGSQIAGCSKFVDGYR
ncbi:MAG: hypothetical protein WC028_12520 [Candidatus Obscuribacterales bacterium]